MQATYVVYVAKCDSFINVAKEGSPDQTCFHVPCFNVDTVELYTIIDTDDSEYMKVHIFELRKK